MGELGGEKLASSRFEHDSVMNDYEPGKTGFCQDIDQRFVIWARGIESGDLDALLRTFQLRFIELVTLQYIISLKEPISDFAILLLPGK